MKSAALQLQLQHAQEQTNLVLQHQQQQQQQAIATSVDRVDASPGLSPEKNSRVSFNMPCCGTSDSCLSTTTTARGRKRWFSVGSKRAGLQAVSIWSASGHGGQCSSRHGVSKRRSREITVPKCSQTESGQNSAIRWCQFLIWLSIWLSAYLIGSGGGGGGGGDVGSSVVGPVRYVSTTQIQSCYDGAAFSQRECIADASLVGGESRPNHFTSMTHRGMHVNSHGDKSP